MSDQDRVSIARGNRRRRMAHMQHEGAPAHSRAVHPARGDSEIVRDLLGHHLTDAGEPVNVLGLEPRIGHGIERGIRVQHDLGHVRDDPDAGGFRRSHHGN